MILSEIWIYPVKSCKGFNQTEAQVQRRGLLNDRRWIFLDENDTFLSQRTLPSLATLRTSIENGRLKFEYEGQMIWVDNNLHQQPKTITVWDKSCEGYAMGKEIDEVLSNWLGKKYNFIINPIKRIANRILIFHFRKMNSVLPMAIQFCSAQMHRSTI